MVFEDRDYQSRLVEEAGALLDGGKRVLLQLATGGGKTVMIAMLVVQELALNRRVVIYTPRREILKQFLGNGFG